MGILLRIRLLVLLSVLGLGFLPAQDAGCICQIPAKNASMLAWLTGHQGSPTNDGASQQLGKAGDLLLQGKTSEGREFLRTLQPDSSANDSLRLPFDVASGTLELAAGDAAASVANFGGKLKDTLCGADILSLAAAYLVQYGSEAPVFPGFNGGFYQYLKDNLNGGQKLNLAQFDRAVGVLYGWFQMSQGKSALALELLGDVLYRHPDRFIGNYFGALVYMRAALLSKGEPNKAVLFDKGLYVLEAPSEAYPRFDRYLYKQMKDAMEFDLADGAAAPADLSEGKTRVETGGVLYLAEMDGGKLAPILRKAWKQGAERALSKSKPVKQVDASEVKQTTTFNLYALLMIGTVIGAIVFFWVKIKQAAKAQAGRE